MKKAAKIWLILAACLILAGLILFGTALAMNNWSFKAWGENAMETEEIEIGADFTSLSVRSDTEEIVFLPSENGRCRVVFYEPEKRLCSATVTGSTLSVETRDSRNWLERLTLFSVSAPKITVYLPKSEYTSLVIEESTGDIALPDAFCFVSIQITAATGSVDCAASASEQIRIKTSTGDIRLHGLHTEKIDLSVSTGKVDVRSAACGGSLQIHVSTGKAFLSDVICGSLLSDGSTGDISMRDVIVTRSMNIERSTGDVSFERCDAMELTIQTGTGDVTGSLLSPKRFSAVSRTGHVEVPEDAVAGRCSITTTTGDIRITCP